MALIRSHELVSQQNRNVRELLDAVTTLNYLADLANADGWQVVLSVSTVAPFNIDVAVSRKQWTNVAEQRREAEAGQ